MTPNRFADRDLMMHFRGGGVGHKSTRAATDFFKSDHDHLDVQQKSLTDEEEEVNEETVMVEAGLEGYAAQSDEEEHYGYQLREDSDDENSQEDDGEELDDEDFGPEDDGGAGESRPRYRSAGLYMKPTVLTSKCNPVAGIIGKIQGNGKDYYSIQSTCRNSSSLQCLYQNSSEIQDCYKNYTIHTFH